MKKRVVLILLIFTQVITIPSIAKEKIFVSRKTFGSGKYAVKNCISYFDQFFRPLLIDLDMEEQFHCSYDQKRKEYLLKIHYSHKFVSSGETLIEMGCQGPVEIHKELALLDMSRFLRRSLGIFPTMEFIHYGAAPDFCPRFIWNRLKVSW